MAACVREGGGSGGDVDEFGGGEGGEASALGGPLVDKSEGENGTTNTKAESDNRTKEGSMPFPTDPCLQLVELCGELGREHLLHIVVRLGLELIQLGLELRCIRVCEHGTRS